MLNIFKGHFEFNGKDFILTLVEFIWCLSLPFADSPARFRCFFSIHAFHQGVPCSALKTNPAFCFTLVLCMNELICVVVYKSFTQRHVYSSAALKTPPQPPRTPARMVGQVAANGWWAMDIDPDLDAAALQQFLQIWPRVAAWEPLSGEQDEFSWTWDASGQFSVRSAYAARFWGREVVPTAKLTWKCQTPLQCRFFAWLALKNRCWTSDRLARRGLPHHSACPLCDQEPETLNHVPLTCVFVRTVWAAVGEALGKLAWEPSHEDELGEWLCAKRGDNYLSAKDIHTILLLVLWEL